MWVCDGDSLDFLDVNEAALRLYGWPRETFLRMNAREIRPPEDLPNFFEAVRRQRKSPRAFVGVSRHCKRDGTVFDVELTISSIRYAGRRARLVLVNEVTERREAEEALRASEERYRSLFENDLTGDFIAEPDGRILLCNPAFAAIFGFSSPGAAQGSSLAALQSNRKAWGDLVRLLKRRKRLVRHESAARRCDGTTLEIVQTVVGTFNRGELVLMQGYVLDDTERKRAEAKLKVLNATLEHRVAERTAELADASDRLRAMTDSALIGILTLNENGVVETSNPAAAGIFGYAPDEMRGRNISDLMASPAQPQGEEFLDHYTRPGDGRFLDSGREVLGQRKDGHMILVEVTVSNFTHGGRRQFVVMISDITTRKRLERELLEVGERERQRLGHDLHDGLGQHLHALFYMATLLEREIKETSPERAHEAGRLARQLEHGLELTRSLARGLQPVNPVPEGLMAALGDLAERTRALYRLDCHFQARTPVLIYRHSTANHLYRIAQEAVNNAVKHGKPTRILIQLTPMRQRIVLRVRDNGVGIRQGGERVRGMGLHIMKYRADAISGSLLVQRPPEGGTEVVCAVTRQALLPQPSD